MKFFFTVRKVTTIITVLFFATSVQAAVVTSGNVTPADPASWTAATNGRVGESADGGMQITSGSSVTSNSGTLGYNVDVTGVVIVNGTGSNWANALDLVIGRYGTGALALQDNGAVSNRYGTIGWLAGSTGTVTVNNGTWTNSASLVLGHQGDGTLDILSGGTVSSADATIGGPFSLDHGSGTATVRGTGSSWTITTGDFRVGNYGTGVLNILDGGVVSSRNGIIGGNAGGGSGAVTINNGDWTVVDQGLLVGFWSEGTLTIENGGTLTNGAWVQIGSGAGITGAATVTGAGSTWTSSGGVNVGYSGSGTLTIADGGLFSNTGGTIGHYGGSTGSVTVNNGIWTNSGDLNVGYDGSGTLTIENGGTVSSASAVIGRDGSLVGSSGTATVTGAGSGWTITNDLVVGGSAGGGMTHSNGPGVGTLNILAGGVVSNSNSYIGSDHDANGNDAIGTVTVDGAGSTWTHSGNLTVGRDGTGTLSVTNGGSVSNDYGTIGNSSTGTGSVTVDGAGSTWSNSESLYVGYDGNGTLDILNGATVSNTAGGYIGTYATGSGTATVDGNGSTWNNSGDLTIGYSGGGTLTVSAGGVVSNVNGTVGVMTDSFGVVTVTGAGSTWSNSGTLTVGTAGSGTLNISSGGEVLAASANIGSTGLLSGDSLMTLNSGTGILTNYGTIAPGNSIGTLTVDGDVVFENGSTFEVEIDNAGNSDLLDVSGDVTINSGSTIAINSNGETITDGKSYTLIEAASITGTFDTLDTALVTWDAAVTSYDMAYDATTAALVIGTPSVTPFDSSSLLRTYNQRAVGHAVEQISTAGGTLGGITAALQGIVAEDDFRYAYDQLSGQIRPSLAPIADAGVSSFAGTILSRMHSSQTVKSGATSHDRAGHEYYFWVNGLGSFGDRDSNDGVNGSDAKTGGVATGLDYLIADDFRAGVSLGLATTDVEYDDTRDNSRIDSFFSALYGNYSGFDGYIDAVLTYAYLDSETDRYVDFVAEKNTGDFHGYEVLATIEAAKNYSYNNILIQPLAGIELGYQHQNSYTETGGSSALRYDDQSFKTCKGSLGIKLSSDFSRDERQNLRGRLQAQWVHEFGDTTADIDVNFVSDPAYRFTIKDAETARDSVRFSTGLDYTPAENTLLFIDYNAQLNADTLAHIIGAGISVAF